MTHRLTFIPEARGSGGWLPPLNFADLLDSYSTIVLVVASIFAYSSGGWGVWPSWVVGIGGRSGWEAIGVIKLNGVIFSWHLSEADT